MKFIVAGDILPWKNNVELFKKGDAFTLFGEKVCNLFESADFSIINLEGPLTDATIKQDKIGPVIKADKETIKGIQALNVKAVALANNHITDYLQKGIDDTLSTLQQAGIKSVGIVDYQNKSKESKYLSATDGQHKVCVYNVSETFFNQPTKKSSGVNIYDEWIVLNEIKELKQQHDYLIVIYHGGAEFFPYPTPQTRTRFHRMADCGADFITAQHTHCIGCEEWYNGSYLLYGQGNFHFAKQDDIPMKTEGLVMEISLDNQGVQINRHRVELNKNYCIEYSKDQSLSSFYERSKNIDNEELIIEEYKQLKPDNIVESYLLAYKGRNYIWNKLKAFFPKKIWKKLIESYSGSQIKRIFFVITSDRASEDVHYIWKKLLDKNK